MICALFFYSPYVLLLLIPTECCAFATLAILKRFSYSSQVSSTVKISAPSGISSLSIYSIITLPSAKVSLFWFQHINLLLHATFFTSRNNILSFSSFFTLSTLVTFLFFAKIPRLSTLIKHFIHMLSTLCTIILFQIYTWDFYLP